MRTCQHLTYVSVMGGSDGCFGDLRVVGEGVGVFDGKQR